MSTRPALHFQACDYVGFLVYTTYAWCALCIPNVLGPLAEDLHFALDEGNNALAGTLAFWRGAVMVVSMTLCGFIAGRWGKRHSLAAGTLMVGGGVLLAATAHCYMALVAALIISAFGQGFFESLVTPLVNENHRAEQDSARFVNITHSFWSVGSISVMLLAGFMLQKGLSWRLVLLFIGLVTLIPGAFFFQRRKEDKLVPGEVRSFRQTWRHAQKAFASPRFWIFLAAMPLASGIEHSLYFWMPTYLQSRWTVGPAAAGIGTALFAAGMFAGRFMAGILGRQNATGRILAGCAFLLLAASLAALRVEPLWMFMTTLFLLGVGTGPVWPGIQNHCVNRLQTMDQTTMLILLPTVGSAGAGVFPWLLGFLADHFGKTGSFMLLPACAAALLLLLGIEGKIRDNA
ncbi:MAG: MFS transporter [Victivallales bacterium]|nr:MFS transporter [Victivallales bacterium]